MEWSTFWTIIAQVLIVFAFAVLGSAVVLGIREAIMRGPKR